MPQRTGAGCWGSIEMYNPLASYEENLRLGPSPHWNRGGFFPEIVFTSEPKFFCLGYPLHLPLGIPAGPLLSSEYLNVALRAGFAMPVYKTVRSSAWASHPWPNVLGVERFVQPERGEARPVATVVPLEQSSLTDVEKRSKLSITNAFGVPSQSPEMWMRDFKNISSDAFRPGFLPGLSFQGSRRDGRGWTDFLDDTALAAQLAGSALSAAGGGCLEMNVSCPNESGAPIYSDAQALEDTLRSARSALKNFPEVKLIIKLGHVPSSDALKVVQMVAEYADGIAAINTISANIVNPFGERALGSKAEHGGICGDVIRSVALESVRRFHEARQSLGLHKTKFALIGVGGCSTFEHLLAFLEAGADVVHAATGAMWNLQLASECARGLGVPFSSRELN